MHHQFIINLLLRAHRKLRRIPSNKTQIAATAISLQEFNLQLFPHLTGVFIYKWFKNMYGRALRIELCQLHLNNIKMSSLYLEINLCTHYPPCGILTIKQRQLHLLHGLKELIKWTIVWIRVGPCSCHYNLSFHYFLTITPSVLSCITCRAFRSVTSIFSVVTLASIFFNDICQHFWPLVRLYPIGQTKC